MKRRSVRGVANLKQEFREILIKYNDEKEDTTDKSVDAILALVKKRQESFYTWWNCNKTFGEIKSKLEELFQ